MSMDPPPAEPEPGAPPPARRGMGTGARVLLTLGMVLGLVLLLSCGVIGYVLYSVRHSVLTNPAAVRQITAKIVTVNLPPQFAPTLAVDNFSFPGMGFSFSVVVYTENPAGNAITLAVLKDKDSEQASQQQWDMIQQLISGESSGAKQMTVDQNRQRTITVRGKPVPFTFSTGKEVQSGKPWLQATGRFQGDSGATQFLFSGDASQYNEDQVAKIIESIR
jgi:hypothetical protein